MRRSLFVFLCIFSFVPFAYSNGTSHVDTAQVDTVNGNGYENGYGNGYENGYKNGNGVAEEYKLVIDLTAGLSFGVGGKKSTDLYHPGFNIALEGFYALFGPLGVGGRLAYNRWGIDEDEFTTNAADNEAFTNIGEIIPSVRYPIWNKAPFGIFGQAGAGLYIIQQFAEDNNVTIIENDYLTRFGFSLGGAATFGIAEHYKILLAPMYNLVFSVRDNTFQYFTVNLGVSFGI